MAQITYDTLKGISAGESIINQMEIFLQIRENEAKKTPFPWKVTTRDGRYYNVKSRTVFDGPRPQ